jgi:hypothetical protein
MAPKFESDWRLTNQEKYLKGAALRLSRFVVRPGKPEWDHEHCDFCWAKIVEEKRKGEGDDLLIEAYATEDHHQLGVPQMLRGLPPCSSGKSSHET